MRKILIFSALALLIGVVGAQPKGMKDIPKDKKPVEASLSSRQSLKIHGISSSDMRDVKPATSTFSQKKGIRKAVIFGEDFESVSSGSSIPTGWTSVENEDKPDGNLWFVGAFPTPQHSGTHAAVSYSYSNDDGPLTPDNWLITPKIELAAGSDYNLSFWVGGVDQNFPAETYDVLVSTTDTDLGSFTSIHHETVHAATGTYYNVQLDLTDYAGEEIYLAFRHHESSDNFAIAIDDVEVASIPTTPEFNGATAISFGNVYQNLNNGKWTQTYTVINGGKNDLTISLANASSELSVTAGLPMTVSGLGSETFTVELDASALSGAYTGSLTLTTNDPENGSPVIGVTATVNTATVTDYVYETFNSKTTLPKGWAHAGFGLTDTGGVDNSKKLTGRVYRIMGGLGGLQTMAAIQTCWINVGSTPEMSFQYRVTDNATTPTAANKFLLRVVITEDYGATWTVAQTIVHTASLNYTTANIDLSAYAGKTVQLQIRIDALTASGDFLHNFDLDNIEIKGTKPSDPVFDGTLSASFGTVYNNLPGIGNATLNYAVTNIGTNDLAVSLASNDAELTVTGLPLSISSNQTKAFSVSVDQSALAVGKDTFDLALTTDDPNQTAVAVKVSVDVQAALIKSFLFEDFSAAGTPEGWTATGFAKDAGGVDNSAAMSVNMYDGGPTIAELTTCYVNMGATPELSFFAKFVEYGTNTPTDNEAYSYTVSVSDDYGKTFKPVLEVAPGEHADGALSQITVDAEDLTEFANKICKVKITVNWIAAAKGDFDVYVDNVLAGTMPANDLSMASFKVWSTVVETGKPAKFQAFVKNEGSTTQSSWNVKLMRKDGTQLNLVAGEEIAQYEVDTVELTYTPTTDGVDTVYAIIDFSGDEYLANNNSKNLLIKVLTADEFLAEIGTGTLNSYMPANFYYNKSLFQAMYYPAELGTNGGKLTSIVYKSKFTNAVVNKTIQVWVGETDSANLSGGFIKPSALTKVFDGAISIPAGDYDLEIPFITPYEYGGKNLVVYTAKIDNNYVSGCHFYATSQAGSKRAVAASSDNAAYDPENPSGGLVSDIFPNTRFVFDGTGLGSIYGVVSDNNGGAPLENVSVKLTDGKYATTTDEDGSYNIPHRAAGTYNIEVSKLGYFTDTVENLALIADEDKEEDITMMGIPVYIVSGNVTGNDGSELEGVTVKLSGYNGYEATTDASGDYSIPDVYAGYTYNVMATLEGYGAYTGTVDVLTADATKDIVLIENLYPVSGVTAEVSTDNKAVVTWRKPGGTELKTYQLDEENLDDGWSLNPNTEASLGNMFEVGEYGTLSSVDVYGEPYADATGRLVTVDIYDANRQLAGSSAPFEIPAGEWLNVPLPDVPYSGTFYAMVHWPATAGATNFLMVDQTCENASEGFDYYYAEEDGGWYPLPEAGGSDPSVFLIRANAESGGPVSKGALKQRSVKAVAFGNAKILATRMETSTATTKAPILVKNAPQVSKAVTEYEVYRLTEGQAETSWTSLGTANDTTYTDDNYSTLSSGIYQYAIKAKYTGDHLSVAKLSNKLVKDMEVAYTVNVTTNSGDDAEGAVVTLTNQDGDAAHVYTETATASAVNFAEVWKGTYDISITKAGFDAYLAQDVAIDAADLSHNATLVETIVEPYSLLVDVQGKTATLSWNNADNNFSDDMESYTNFIIANIGEYTLYDGDQAAGTYGFNNLEFTNQYYAGSWIVLNPSATTPSMLDEYSEPHSGNKMLACFAATNGEGTPPIANNDWLILPKTMAVNGTKFEFWAKTYDVGYPEKMKVSVSTTGTAPADFTVISTGSSVTVPTTWTKYTYDLSSYAGKEIHVAITCVSEDMFILFVDDIFFGVPTKSERKSFSGYTVYLDNVEKATGITETEYTFTDLEDGDYVAGVKAVYSSGASEMATIDFVVDISSIIDQIAGKAVKAWVQNEKIHVSGLTKGTEYRLYNVLGTLIYRGVASSDVEELPCTLMRGTYIIQSGKHSVKMAY